MRHRGRRPRRSHGRGRGGRALGPGRGAALPGRRRRWWTCAAAHWSVEGDLETLELAVSDGRAWSRTYPGRAQQALVGAPLPARGRRAGLGRARATSSWTGAAPTTSAAAATAPLHRAGLARRPDHVRNRSRVGVRAGPVDDPRRGARDRRPLRHRLAWLAACRIDAALAARRAGPCPHARSARPAAPAQLVPAGEVLRGRRVRLRGEPLRVRGLREPALDAPPGGGDLRVRRRGREQLLVEPALDVRRRRRSRRLPGGAVLHGQRRGLPLRAPRSSRCS